MREAASELALDADTIYELMLATTEAFANAVEHGEPCKNGGHGIQVRIESRERGLGVEISDCGEGFAESGAISRKPEGEGGRGIPIIAAVVDELEVLLGPGRTRVRFEKWLAAG